GLARTTLPAAKPWAGSRTSKVEGRRSCLLTFDFRLSTFDRNPTPRGARAGSTGSTGRRARSIQPRRHGQPSSRLSRGGPRKTNPPLLRRGRRTASVDLFH